MNILVTGGAGFIGSALIRHIIADSTHKVLNFDKLTYAGNLQSLASISNNPRYQFCHADICDYDKVQQAFDSFCPDIVMHLAAESHVDRSISHARAFIDTNIVGTYTLLQVAKDYYARLPKDKQAKFRFHHISTDEVYGDLADSKGLFVENTPYAPSSPYAASKASADHLVRAWYRTYGLPIVLTNCSNNYGPYHFPEKLIPLTILNALSGKPLPVYGDGTQVRDWLFVEDHARALLLVATTAKVGSTYNIGGHNEQQNIDVVRQICHLLDNLAPNKPNNIQHYHELIRFVGDRPGHDVRYAIDAGKIKQELGFTPKETFATGLQKTVQWYLDNQDWVQSVQSGDYQAWLDTQYKNS